MIDWLQLILVSFLTIFIISTIHLNSKYPGPFSLPILGSLALLIKLTRLKTHEETDKHQERYGNFLKINYTNRDVFVIIDATEARRIMAFKKRATTLSDVSPGIMDHVLFAMETNEEWHLHRKLLSPGFSPINLKYSAKASLQVSKTLVDQIVNGQEYDVLGLMGAVALDVIGLFAFGEDVGAVRNPEKSSLWTNIADITMIPAFLRTAIPFSLWPWFGMGVNSKWVVSNRKKIHDYLQGVIERAKKTKEARVGGLDRSMNIMQRLLQTEDEGKLSKEEVFGEVLGFFVAG